MAENQTPSNSYGSPCYLQMRKIHSKVKVLEWSQHISHCKSMQIFYDASKVGSTLNQTHPSFYGCPCYLKE